MAMMVTERDRHLCGVVSEVKWIGVEGVKKLLPGRAEPEIRNVLARLSTGPRELLRKQKVYGRNGPETMYALTDAGLVEAQELLGRVVEPASREFNQSLLEHHNRVIDLYLGLLTHGVRQQFEAKKVPSGLDPNERKKLLSDVYARATHSWRWTTSASERLEWREFANATRPAQDRFIMPDAIVEFPQAKRRAFVEYETGENVLVGHGQKPSATLNKLERYAAFMSQRVQVGIGNAPTWYANRYPDQLRPYLVIVAPSGRVATTEAVFKEWKHRKWALGLPFEVRILTSEGAVERMLSWAGVDVPPVPKPRECTLTEREVSAVQQAFDALRNQAAASKLPWPPPGFGREQSLIRVFRRMKAT